jgi:hypothetical protein
LLKLANKLARAAANKNNSLTWDEHGLARIPSPIMRWGLGKAAAKLPPVTWSASGYARGLSTWIVENVTQAYAVEFSTHHPAGFAGTADGLISVSPETLERHGADPALAGAPLIADWKTSASKRSPAMMHDYTLQCGAYALGLEHLTGIRPAGAFIVVARRIGAPNVTFLSARKLADAKVGYLERVALFYRQLETAIQVSG